MKRQSVRAKKSKLERRGGTWTGITWDDTPDTPEHYDDLDGCRGIALTILAGVVIWGIMLGLLVWAFLVQK